MKKEVYEVLSLIKDEKEIYYKTDGYFSTKERAQYYVDFFDLKDIKVIKHEINCVHEDLNMVYEISYYYLGLFSRKFKKAYLGFFDDDENAYNYTRTILGQYDTKERKSIRIRTYEVDQKYKPIANDKMVWRGFVKKKRKYKLESLYLSFSQDEAQKQSIPDYMDPKTFHNSLSIASLNRWEKWKGFNLNILAKSREDAKQQILKILKKYNNE